MNYAVASYALLVVVAGVVATVSTAAFKHCAGKHCRMQPKRDHRPTMLAMFVSVAWIVVGINGVLIKYSAPKAALSIDPAIVVLLICFTLTLLGLFIRDLYKRIHCHV